MEEEKSRKTVDMIHGTLGDKMLKVAVPLALTGILQQLFNATSVAVLGRFVGKNAMAAVGSNSALIGLLLNLFIGVSMGANVVIARFTGQRNKEAVSRAVHTAILVSLISGFGMILIGELLAAPVVRLLGVPDDVFAMALLYLRIYLIGMPVILLYNFESAIFRSQGNTRTPLICLLIAGCINLGLNLFFVIVLHMNVNGAATATVISNCVSSGLMMHILRRRSGALHLSLRALRIDGKILKEILRIGVPAGMQGMVFSLSNICIQSAINSLGSTVMAASAAAFNIEIFEYYVVTSFGQTGTTFISQNSGAGFSDRCRKVSRICLLQDLLAAGVSSALLLFFGRHLLSVFNTDPAVITTGIIRLKFILGGEIINAFIEVMSDIMRGYGYSLVPALASLIGICGVRILWVYTLFAHFGTFGSLMAAYPGSWTVTAIVVLIAYLVMRHRKVIA
jgi:putative MATE family efflux protein